jgi:integrase
MAKPIKHGSKWRVRWMDEAGVRRSAVFDTYKEAELASARVQLEVDETRRGLRPPADTQNVTFDELGDRWMEFRAAHKRSSRSDRSILDRHLRPTFGKKKLPEVTVAEIDAFKSKLLRKVKPKTVHNILTLLVAMLNYAVDLGWLAKPPRVRKPKIVLNPHEFRYLRTENEIRRFLRAARQEGEDVFVLYATAIYTGMRAGELAGLKWSCVSFERRLITVQASYDGPTKAGDVRYVPLLDPLLPVLREWRLKVQGDLVFPNEAGNMHSSSARAFQEVLHRVLDRAGFPDVLSMSGESQRYITFHGLRHTFASQWMMSGGDIFKLQRIGGWKSFEMVQRYAHLAPHAFAEDWGRFGAGPSFEESTVAFEPARARRR